MHDPEAARREARNHAHRLTVFSVSTGMVGVCLTGVGLVNVLTSMQDTQTLADEMLAGAAMLFLVSGSLNFFTMRRRDQAHWTALDTFADSLFFLALALVLAGCVVISLQFGKEYRGQRAPSLSPDLAPPTSHTGSG